MQPQALRAFCLWSGRRQPPTPTPGSGRLRPLSHRHLASPSAADGQSGRTSSGKDRCVHSLATQHRDQCQDTASRFIEAAPRYRLDWTAVGYSRVATGAFWDSLLVVASGGHPSNRATSASTRSPSGRWFDIRQCPILWVSHRHFGLATICLWSGWRPPPHRKSGLHSLRFVNLCRVI